MVFGRDPLHDSLLSWSSTLTATADGDCNDLPYGLNSAGWVNFHTSFSDTSGQNEPSPSPRKRSVRIQEGNNVVHRTMGRWMMSPEEKRDAWYDEEDINSIRSDIARVVASIRFAAAHSGTDDNDSTTTTTSMSPEELEMRGLEHLRTPCAVLKRDRHKAKVIEAVLAEQELQRHWRSNDSIRGMNGGAGIALAFSDDDLYDLAEASETLSLRSREMARARGAADAAEQRRNRYLSTTTKAATVTDAAAAARGNRIGDTIEAEETTALMAKRIERFPSSHQKSFLSSSSSLSLLSDGDVEASHWRGQQQENLDAAALATGKGYKHDKFMHRLRMKLLEKKKAVAASRRGVNS